MRVTESTESPPTTLRPERFALLGNPNTGKTTLFNRLCGLRARTGNYPGTTVEARFGQTGEGPLRFDIVDLPGIYGLFLEQPESVLCRQVLDGELTARPTPDAVVVVVDANNLRRNLVLVGEVLTRGLPTVVAVNMTDLARRQGNQIDADTLGLELGCPVVAVSARTGEGIATLLEKMASPRIGRAPFPSTTAGPDASPLAEWAERLVESAAGPVNADTDSTSWTDRIDAFLMHPVSGLSTFAAVMTFLFMAIFSFATTPMDLIDLTLGRFGGWLETRIPAGAIQSLVVDGIVGGIAGTVVFVPQIFLLFFLISLLEDTGYLARAALVIDRIMRRFGLPGHAFVPLLSSHACAIPGILCTRLIPDRRDRLATILVAPFMSCSARLPVYVLLIGLLFGDAPVQAGLAFTGCYTLGATAALGSAFVARRTLLRGTTRPMLLELPTYKWPSLRNALLVAVDRSRVFLRKAGTVILGICILMWWLSTYPQSEPPAEAESLRAEADRIAGITPERAEALRTNADRVEARHALSRSFAGRLGRTIEPIFEPLGYDWQLTIAVLTSFAAREVFVSTLAVIVGAGDDIEDPGVRNQIRQARRDDGAPLLDPASAASLLIFYVLALQCLPTLAVTRREAGGWRWALLQLGYMSVLAYVAAFVTWTTMTLSGGA